jgi:DNA polymerase-2
LLFGHNGRLHTLPLHPLRHLLTLFQAKLKRLDPDIVLTKWGDTWLFPTLIKQSQAEGLPFRPSRDPARHWLHKKGQSYFTYGQVIYRGEQTWLYGRWHIDVRNAMMFNQYQLRGVLEQAQVTGMPVQEMARRSPGAGITAMQMITALRRGVLVPYTKQQAEYFKSARQLIRSDRGGLVYQPQVGLHTDVAEIDFVSMYPAIISRFNISAETVVKNSDHMAIVPELGMLIDQSQRGLLPETLQPLLEKRVTLKQQLAGLTHQDCRYGGLKSRSTALKWLLVVAFGYAGYKRARFGRIEAHEAITAYSREAMLRAKEVAEAAGYEVLHMYVDGLWLKRSGGMTKESLQPLLKDITESTGLPIALEGIYQWLAFLPSKLDARVPVPNRYFGILADKSVKLRGIEARRRDTAPFITQLQLDIFQRLARVADISQVDAWLPGVLTHIQRCIHDLINGRIPLEKLLICQTLSREVATYKIPSPAARAAAQLIQVGKLRYPGQSIRFVYVKGVDGIYAWNLPTKPGRTHIDVKHYTELTMRAVVAILQPLGVDEAVVRALALGQAWQRPLPLPALKPSPVYANR